MSSHQSHRFLIVRLGALGDVIHGIPVVAALRERFPSARIDWLVDPHYVDLLAHVRGIDTVIPVDTRRPAAVLSTMGALRGLGYTAALDLQGLIKSAVLTRLSGAWRTIGFSREFLREPAARFLYTETVAPDGRPHVVYRNLALLTPLGARDIRPRFPIAVPTTPVVEEIEGRFGRHRYALINPGAAWPNKRWPAARFGALAAAIHERLRLPSVIIWGPGEGPLAAAVVDAAGGAAQPAPPTNITDLMGLARGARVMVSGDTGPLHIAAAVGTPVVSLFGPTRADRNGPWSSADIRLTRTDGCSCLYRRRCRRATPCIHGIAVDEVITAVEQRLMTHA